ncbi:hypothetical protein [Schlesneria sp. T3-172]|uniref:hypothetical protein n=1 Tax=Schlesneria sphaerica TaxID=3373610 RepID=UPI0037C82B17
MQQFQYGPYFHDKQSVAFNNVRRSLSRSETGRANLLTTEWSLRGKIIRPTEAEILAELALLKLAYSNDGYSATMLDNNGNPTTFMLDNNLAVGGVRVNQPISHGDISGAHGATYLKYEFGLAADYLVTPGGYLSFQEMLIFDDIDGGPIQVERLPAKGPPILQNVTERSWYYATQQGTLTQQASNVGPMPPLWPDKLRKVPGAKQVRYAPVKTIKGKPIEYGCDWHYTFVSDGPFSGRPRVGG